MDTRCSLSASHSGKTIDEFWYIEKVVPLSSLRSRVVDLRHVKDRQAEARASEQNFSDFSRSM